MFKSKSFHLVSEDDRHHEQLYQAKNSRCVKYIVFPALIGFVLLLILVNVDFTGTAYQTEGMPEMTVIQDGRSARASGCYTVNNCQYICDYGNVANVEKDLESLQKKCVGDLTLLLDGCSLPSGRLKRDFLIGTYRLENFTVNDCGLESIDNQAFETSSVQNLKVLLLRKSLFITLSATTFVGLTGLQQFVLENKQRITPLTARKFLEPIAKTVVDVVLQHQSQTSVYDPTPWLEGNVQFSQLRTLDMHGNRFANNLRNETFALMTQLQELDLSFCELTHIANGTFDSIAQTLRKLHLNNNKLVWIDWHFLSVQQMQGSKDFELIAHDNLWNCTCDNKELVEYVKSTSDTLAIAPMCHTPQCYYQVSMVFVFLECDDYTTVPTTTLTTTITTTTEPSNTTTIGDESSWDDSSSADDTEETDEPNTMPTTSPPPLTITTTDIITPTEAGPTTMYPEFIQFQCAYENTLRLISLSKCDVDFGIVTDSATSIRLVTQHDLAQLHLVYFNETRQFYKAALLYDDDAAAPTAPTSALTSTKINEIHIDGLDNEHTYTFCLVPRLQTSTSPFNCRSHYVYVSNAKGRKWLDDDDVAWFVSVIVLSVVLCLLTGLLITYSLLRMRPTWLRGCPGVQPINDHSKKVLLFPTKSSISLEEQYVFSELIKKHGSMSDVHSSENGLEPNANDYMQFYRNLELSKIQKDATCSVANRPPEEAAPKLPALPDSRPISSQSLVRREATIYENDEDNYYESVSYYQQVF